MSMTTFWNNYGEQLIDDVMQDWANGLQKKLNDMELQLQHMIADVKRSMSTASDMFFNFQQEHQLDENFIRYKVLAAIALKQIMKCIVQFAFGITPWNLRHEFLYFLYFQI